MSTTSSVFIAAMLVGAGDAVGWWATDKDFTADIANLNADHATALKVISDKAQQDTAAAIANMKAAQNDLAALNKSSREKLDNVQAENDAMRADVAAGNRRVQFAKNDLATCKRSANAISVAGSVGDDAGVELSIRAGIINDQAKLNYLQNYIAVLQKSGVIAAPSTQETTK